MAGHSIVDLQVMAFETLDALCSGLSDAEWKLDTECPGWTVQDNLSHLLGTESSLLGRPNPEHEVGDLPHIKNPIGAGNEVHVDYRRSWPGSTVLEEYREVTGERTKILRAMSEEELDADSWTPIGPGQVRDLLAVRCMDFWVHDQDIRRAIGKPGDLTGPLAEHAINRHTMALGFVVGKKADLPEGSTVVWSITGPIERDIAVIRDGKRASVMDEAPASPTVKLSMDLETFNRLCTGRGDPQEVAKGVQIEGDAAMAQKIIENSNFMI